MLKKVIKIQIVDNFVAWYYRFARERARERLLLPPSLISISSLEASPRWWDDSVHLKMIFSHAQTLFYFHSRRTICRVVSVCLFVFVFFFFLWIGVTTIQRMSLSNARSRASCSSLTHSLSHARVHSSLQRWYYVHFVSSFKNQSFFFLRKLFFLRLRVGFAICKI